MRSRPPSLLTAADPPKRTPGARPVFRTATLEALIMVAVTGGLILLSRFVTYQTGNNSRTLIGIALALLPLGLWIAISYRAELNAQNTRSGLLVVLVLSMLAANGLGVPLVDRVFAVEDWIAGTSGLQRIIGYALTAGFIQEFLKLAVVRYSVWGSQVRTRRDGIAYSLAASLGYATVLAINYVIADPALTPDPVAVALRVTGYTLSHFAIGAICGYTLADLRIGQPSILWLPVGLTVAAMLQGVFVSLRAGSIVGAFSEKATGSQSLPALGIAAALFFVLFGVINFLISSTDSRERRSPEFNR